MGAADQLFRNFIELDDFAFSIDEQCALHVGAYCNAGIMDTHSPQNLQGYPAYVDFVDPFE
jgi:hypothetical protein